MATNKIPPLKMDDNPTGCCPRFDPKEWDEKTSVLDKKLFAKAETINFIHFPLNIKSMMTNSWKKITDAKATDYKEFLMLATDRSPWRGEYYFAVTKKVPGLESAYLSGTFLAKVLTALLTRLGNGLSK